MQSRAEEVNSGVNIAPCAASSGGVAGRAACTEKTKPPQHLGAAHPDPETKGLRPMPTRVSKPPDYYGTGLNSKRPPKTYIVFEIKSMSEKEQEKTNESLSLLSNEEAD